MFFWTWRAGVDADFQMGQFARMGEDVIDILLPLQNVFDHLAQLEVLC